MREQGRAGRGGGTGRSVRIVATRLRCRSPASVDVSWFVTRLVGVIPRRSASFRKSVTSGTSIARDLSFHQLQEKNRWTRTPTRTTWGLQETVKAALRSFPKTVGWLSDSLSVVLCWHGPPQADLVGLGGLTLSAVLGVADQPSILSGDPRGVNQTSRPAPIPPGEFYNVTQT